MGAARQARNRHADEMVENEHWTWSERRTQGSPGSVDRELLFSVDQVAAARERVRRPGRPGRGDLFYARVAAAYDEWLDSGDRLGVLAERLHMSEPALRAVLGDARRKGMLTKAPPGRSGGRATDRAKRLLEEAGATPDEEI